MSVLRAMAEHYRVAMNGAPTEYERRFARERHAALTSAASIMEARGAADIHVHDRMPADDDLDGWKSRAGHMQAAWEGAATHRDQLVREVQVLRGLKPELPPFPPEGEGLPRYGLKWNGPGQPLAVPMPDGYWTPFHLVARPATTK